MEKNFDIIDMADEDTNKFAKAMSSETTKKVFNYLKKHKATISEISKALKLPISTIQYSIQKLQKANLIKIHDYHWSPKGNKVFTYTMSNKIMVFTPEKSPELELKIRAMIFVLVALIGLTAVIYSLYTFEDGYSNGEFSKFSSEKELLEALESARNQRSVEYSAKGGVAVLESAAEDSASLKSSDYSDTNIQVLGVDEADIIKTDGEYIYLLSNNKLIIAKAYPSDEAEILANYEFKEGFYPSEIFVDEERLLVFGSSNNYVYYGKEVFVGDSARLSIFPFSGATQVMLFDISEKSIPSLLRTIEFEGSYLSSRKIDSNVYFVINSYPSYETFDCLDVIPAYTESYGEEETSVDSLSPIVNCTEVGYVKDAPSSNFLTIVSIDMEDENKEIEKEVILGNGQNIYASKSSIYVSQTSWEREEKTYITKFNLDNGKIIFDSSGEVPGYILNQFSMDEHEGYFRIATTKGQVWETNEKSTNNLYILDKNLEVVGSIEGLAPGESIYSVRFMGDKGYVVTFKRVDPLFVLDLKDPTNPTILGKLKIPGYSDYLHPYDENHLIGIGKEVDEGIDSDKVHEDDAVYYTAIQGIKISIFDVSDLENPKEIHKVVIGDRGTESLATYEHKAFLFDKEKGLLVIPINVVEFKEGQSIEEQGEYTFQGAYVYNINLEEGLDLRGRVSHIDGEEVYDKYGYYPDYNFDIRRSLYIEDVLYTLSNNRLQLSDLETLDKIKSFDFI